MIVYFADRQLNIIGQASTELPEGLIVTSDLKTEDVETGVAIFECKIPFDKETRAMVEECTEVGNHVLRSHNGDNEFYTIIDTEIDTKKQQVYIYAEDDGMDLLNEVVGVYAADKAYLIDHYINKYAASAGFVIGINEAKNLTRKLSWDGEATAAERIASVATQFDGCEVSYSFDIDGLYVTKKYINIYKKRGKDIGIQLRLNQDIDSIVTTKSIANLATALQCTGGTPDDDNFEDDIEPVAITLEGYEYDDGDFYVDGNLLKSREALKRWSRYLWKTEDSQKSGGHIVKQYSYDTLNQATLCAHAITELKKIRDMEVNYEVDISKFPDNVKIGDRVNIVDDAGELYVSARVLLLETSVADQEHKAVLGEYLIKNSGIAQKVAELAARFAKASVSAARALELAKEANEAALSAKDEVDEAIKSVEEAEKAVQEVTGVVEEAKQAANNAQAAADAAQDVVNNVEDKIETLETTVTNAQQAASNAQQAANTATDKADEAKTAAQNAQKDAETAKNNSEAAITEAENASGTAATAKNTAETAKGEAEAATKTAASAKADAEQAKKDIAALGEELETVSTTMETHYTRKTEFTETTADLQSQISQNSAQITTTVSKVAKIDETANDAQKQLEGAVYYAEKAQEQANRASEEAEAAQQAATNAATAASNAQAEADTAKAAANTARSVADQAKADLAAAKADLETVSSRADATEAEIAAAQQAVDNAQATAATAQAECDAAVEQAEAAQRTANEAAAKANEAQLVADSAASEASLAQKIADEAKGDAEEAQAKANEAAETAAEAQRTALDAVNDAENAQVAADQAAADAIAAQTTANDAIEKANQAASNLATAEQNLADVLANVDATEEEVAEAQSAVETAQAAADVAQAEAEAAQTTADEANAYAETAQTAADEAKTLADEAQQAAKEAQEAADKARLEVNSLIVNMLSAETKITQNSDQISLTAKQTDERFGTAESQIQQLANCIATLVTDGSGESLMTQTEDGWTFNMAQISGTLDKATADIGGLTESLGGVDNTVSALQQAVADLGVISDYVIITTYEDQPCIELGEAENGFKLRITNTQIQFLTDGTTPAWLSNQKLFIEKAEVTDELQFGGFVWRTRSNGNMGLSWKGVSS